MTKKKSHRVALFVLTALLCAACASEEPAASNEPAGASPDSTIGTLRGKVSYSGSQSGTSVRVAAFREFPPKGPPVAAQTYPSATFPLEYELTVPAGSYKAMAFLDIAGDSFSPTAGDPMSPPYDATVPAGGAASTDMTIE